MSIPLTKLKKMLAVFMACLLMTIPLMSIQSGKAEAAAPALNLKVKSAILVEASTGKILYKYNENQAFPPASMTKMMTEYLLWQAIQNHKVSWDQVITADDYAAYIAKAGGSSSAVLLASGEKHTLRELYEGMAIYSANDATVLIAETIAGTEENFVKEMNKKAKEFGMTQTHFATASGFPVKELGKFAPPAPNGDNMMSARDAAILAKKLITTYPDVLKTTSIPKKMFRTGARPFRMDNWNWMLPGLVQAYPGVDGLKTGHTDEAKFCFTGTAQRNGVRLIAVVMGADSMLSRFGETKKLFDYGFSNYKMQPLANKGTSIKGSENAPVQSGKDTTVPAVTSQNVLYPIQIGEENKYQLKGSLQTLQAPVKKGQAIGSVMVVGPNGQAEDFLTPADQQKAGGTLVAQNDVDKGSWIRLAFRSLFHGIGSLFGSLGHMIGHLFSK
ncbi:D-alanyl-D-alanine carboxypeptidase [Aneurinibacillus sp. Ricciae_BoGa-3]|uniref:D-alanyl-D-alanine carboxypeptidase family protein n=1 Tax=Aneurinibacillus sp. Ricciae_BoGa-3 TaxID=3022697 RepID=UPI002340DD29|nr:D-alanyl-D-alanine carboxypeptidase family protein [Aneurinibacillus sp. Ricciae_BoGa-3]WCK54535.1 D-alanyl-D-alanine carboxypeptidase [Aneurinibacillus sp. Ricciae_BoGa-3]